MLQNSKLRKCLLSHCFQRIVMLDTDVSKSDGVGVLTIETIKVLLAHGWQFTAYLTHVDDWSQVRMKS